MTKAKSEYFELDMSAFESEKSYFGILESNNVLRVVRARELGAVIDGKQQVNVFGLLRAKQEGSRKRTDESLPVQEMGTSTFFLHDSFYAFLRSLNIDELWDTYPVELYEKDRKTRIPNYHHGLVVKQHVGFVIPPWAVPFEPGEQTCGLLTKKGAWFNEAELKDDRLFCINQGPPTFRQDIKEKIEAAFPEGLEWTNLRDT